MSLILFFPVLFFVYFVIFVVNHFVVSDEILKSLFKEVLVLPQSVDGAVLSCYGTF